MKKFLILLALILITKTAALGGVAVVGSLARTKSVKPGNQFDGIVLLKNSDAQAADVRVYQTDYRFHADGRNEYDDPGTAPRSNAPWFSVSPTRFTIGPKETVAVAYKGTVPDRADLRGTYWSMIMVEPAATPPPVPAGGTQQVAVGLQTLIRFGVQIVTEIGDTAPGALKVADKRLAKADGRLALELDLENTGERVLIPSVWVELFNKDGVSIGKFEAGRARIYPACSIRSSVNLTDVPPGRYMALVIIDNGDEHVLGAQYDLEIRP